MIAEKNNSKEYHNSAIFMTILLSCRENTSSIHPQSSSAFLMTFFQHTDYFLMSKISAECRIKYK